MTTPQTILVISASTRGAESVTDLLSGELVSALGGPDAEVRFRRVDDLPTLDQAVTAELTTPVAERSPQAAGPLALADDLIEELIAADTVVIGAPIYNFGVPAGLKAWADLVARAGTTFTYGETGPLGMLADRPTYIVSASGGTEIGGDQDFGTRWLRHYLGFLGITDVTVIGANRLAFDPEAGLAAAREAIVELTTVVRAA